MEFNPDKPCDEMHRVKEKLGVYQRERTAPMHTCRGVHKKMRNLDMSVGGTHRYCAYRTGGAQNNPPEFEVIKNQVGLNRFVLSVKQWVTKTNSKGIIAKAGRYGGTYAHTDIAFEFASWISPQFKLYLIKEFQRLKDEEQKQLGWDIRRNLTKINYRIHTDAIKENLNAVFINERLEQAERLTRLNLIAIQQMRILVEDRTARKLEGSDE
jgi:hypothetical protein